MESEIVVASNEAFSRETSVVRRVREWLDDVEAAEANSRLRGVRYELPFERARSLQNDVSTLRTRLSRLHSLFPELASVELSELLERASERLSVEVT